MNQVNQSAQLIEWPEAFSHDDSAEWRNIKDFEKRMQMIAFHAKMNAEILKGE